MKQKELIFNIFVNRNWKKLTESRKSHLPIETLLSASCPVHEDWACHAYNYAYVFQIDNWAKFAFLASYRVTFAKKLVLLAQEILLPYLEESILNKNYF